MSNLILNHDVGILIAPKNTELEIMAVKEFLSNYRIDRLLYRARSLHLVNERYNWNSHGRSYEALYGKLL